MDYERIEKEESPQALRLARWIEKNLMPETIIDFGCATGFYLKPFKRIEYAVGIDFNKENKSGLIKEINHIQLYNLDLTKDITGLFEKFDLGLCLEVLEHINENSEDKVIDTLVKYCRTLIFSAAIPGQSGDGHINLKLPKHWLKQFERRGMFYDAAETQSLRQYMLNGAHMGWFTNNMFIVTGSY